MTDIDSDFDRAGIAFEALADGPASRAALAIEAAFERTGSSIEHVLGQAARSGETSFSNMTEAIIRDLARLAAEQFIEKPVNQLMENVISSLPLFGARAEGGPVTAGGAYLVGERGPELFVPSAAGAIETGGTKPLVVNLNFGPGSDVRSIQQNQTRIATALARAVTQGSRHL
jgi:phage-related minor tail protein